MVPPAQARPRGRPSGSVNARREEQPNLPNDLNAPSQCLIYHKVLLNMMSHFDNCEYP